MSSLHRPTFVRLAQGHQWTHGAELGVDKGILFEMLLTGCPSLHLVGVDTFPIEHRFEKCFGIAARFAARARLLRMLTSEAAALVPDGSLDFVFIDADHSRSAVLHDIARWTPKVRAGGWVGGHDYNRKFPGVIAAVHESFTDIETYPGSIWGVWR